MALLPPARFKRNGLAPTRLGPTNPSDRGQDDSGVALGALPLDGAGLLGLLAKTSALRLASGAGSSDEADELGPGAARATDDLSRQRYVSGIADQINQGSVAAARNNQSRIGRVSQLMPLTASGPTLGPGVDQESDQTGSAMPAVLRGLPIRSGAEAQFSSIVPVQFSRVMPNAGRAPLGFPGSPSDDTQKKIARGLMGVWESLQQQSGSLSGDSTTDPSDIRARSLEPPNPLGVIIGLVAQMARKSGSADRRVQQRAKIGGRAREEYHDPDNECLTRWEREDARCQRFSKAGYDWVLGCKARAADRLRLCYRNGYKPDPNEPPEFDWIDIDPDDSPEQ